MRRHYITEGAYTTAGGVVVSATSRKTIDGVRAAVEGDSIACPSCKSAGYIVCTGPRIPELYDGKAIALENDFCVCRCVPPPRLIPSQGRWFQTIEENASASEPYQISGDNRVNATFMEQTGRHFLVKSSESGQPLANRRFVAMVGDAKQEGVTDKSGYAHVDAGYGESI